MVVWDFWTINSTQLYPCFFQIPHTSKRCPRSGGRFLSPRTQNIPWSLTWNLKMVPRKSKSPLQTYQFQSSMLNSGGCSLLGISNVENLKKSVTHSLKLDQQQTKIKTIHQTSFFPSSNNLTNWLPSRELTYPIWGKGKSSSKCHFWGDMLVPWGVFDDLSRFSMLFLFACLLCYLMPALQSQNRYLRDEIQGW